MALITSKTLITSISLFHITLGFFFLTNPSAINDQILVQVLGQSMGIPFARGFDAQSHTLAFLSIVLVFFGLSDLFSLGMPEELGSLYYWGTQAPLRAFLSILLTFYTYTFGPSSPFYGGTSHRTRTSYNTTYSPASWGGDGLKNRVFFTFVFIEMIAWFWVWVTLREERAGVVERMRRGASGKNHAHDE
ncbi:increased loss of mitochondrial DNA protein 1 [Pochonia chlamydosporia 170]|uniref:Increased loss of mitochondrial DNA protein 1 n=1 Tax=Pochonia chlamydosporia 170 TaxID=1380566 RepID=A0A179F2V7_METCM|nr:increased loss of mitochondrial DNA protein 1 [Pochonia chlamydosporia 170]OAQ59409.1 increased loss of mitochondrial DNA protein 1 [Pochonia chlamydosporia 170]